MSYENALIYVLSGTGNSYRAANWIANILRQKGSVSRIVNIEGGLHPDKPIESTGRNLLGFVFPTHGFTAPWLIIKFVFRIPRAKNADAFVVATRAGLKAGPVFIPGLEGTAAYLVALILTLKGYRIRGVTGLDMPSNWMSLHPGFRIKAATAMIERCERKITKFTGIILDGKTAFWSLIFLIIGILLIPISLAYLLMGRFFLAKLFFSNTDCNGCGLCAKNCPVNAIKMIGKTKPRPYWTFDCESCMRCMGYCPQKAVEASHSLFAFFMILYSIVILPFAEWFLVWLIDLVPSVTILQNDIGMMLLLWPASILSVFITYGLFYLLNRVPLFNTIFTYTTFTKIYHRYTEPDTKVKDLKD